MFKRFAFAVLFLFLPAYAAAGSFVDGLYTSDLGYTIRPPKSWVRLDASNASAMAGHVPKNIDIVGVSRFDVVFFPAFSDVDTSLAADNERVAANKAILKENKKAGPDALKPPASDTAEPPEFSPSLSVIVLSSRPSKTAPEMAKAYSDKLVSEVREMSDFSDFEVKEATMDNSLLAGDAFAFTIGFRRGRMAYVIKQWVIFRADETVIVTCINDENEHMDDKFWCSTAVNSLKFK